MTLQELIQINSRLEMDFLNLTQVDSRLKKLPEYYFDANQLTTQTFQNFDSNRLMTQNPIWNIDWNQVMTQWLESTVDIVDLFGLSRNLVDFFGGISTKFG